MTIQVQNITKLYGKQKALNNISFEVDAAEIIGFLGPNGAGKSTMMKIITCFIPPTSGNVKVCGFDIAEQSIDVRKNVGYLPENNPLYLDMYVKEYFLFIAGLHKLAGNRINRVKEMIDMTGLGLEQHKKIEALSKGYRQRVGIAQAMIHNPKVLILDEPTSGLDPNQLTEIRNLIKEIGKEKTVMLSTHIMQEVEAICNKVIIINKGEIVANTTTHELRNNFGSKQIISVEFDKLISANLIKAINGVKSVENVIENNWKITALNETDIRPEIFQFAIKNNLTVLTINKEVQSIEEVFQKLTK
ncbi:MAG: gliding motility-associated ABC transporter ATP-binding subunit GldA [Bacteroidetes bacterium RIFCSPLOWO2_12_FULL_31_6]|nr:MAG: gliding motility-associated ABC transporter ATP-binding subunit GldA [Bacteroidetes bacterium RIFCSPLOWO2_12_FULL_31_6]